MCVYKTTGEEEKIPVPYVPRRCSLQLLMLYTTCITRKLAPVDDQGWRPRISPSEQEAENMKMDGGKQRRVHDVTKKEHKKKNRSASRSLPVGFVEHGDRHRSMAWVKAPPPAQRGSGQASTTRTENPSTSLPRSTPIAAAGDSRAAAHRRT
uniref:Uncharacterized protein n=1 Tax=Oryza punctata TaxID=4537 RepID=A0A0E0LGY4_ORYPU